MYDTSGGGSSYVEAALSSIGVSSEQLVLDVAERDRNDVKSTKVLPWPPRVEELEAEEELSSLICCSCCQLCEETVGKICLQVPFLSLIHI